MSKIRRLFTAAALALCALLPSVAMAQSVLLLATSGSQYIGDKTSKGNLPKALEASGATVTFGFGSDARILDDTSTDIDGIFSGGYDIVIVATGGANLITDVNLDRLKTQIQTSTSSSFIILSDGCKDSCSNMPGETDIDTAGFKSNLKELLNIVGQASGMSLKYTPGGSSYSMTNKAKLNPVSLYSSHFSGLTEIGANAYGAIITGSNEDNRLYGTDPDDALAIFVPQTQMTKVGNGACTFLAGDLNMFQSIGTDETERKKIASALLSAVHPDSPACKPSDVLLLTTEETGAAYIAHIDRLETALVDSGIDYKIKKGLTTGDISGINFSDYKTVIVATGEQAVSSTNFAILEDQIKNKNETAFVIFSDGCTSCGSTFGDFAGVLGVTGTNGPGGTSYSGTDGAERNSLSIYSSHFSELYSIRANAYGHITGADVHNKIYGTHADGALAVFMPQKQMNGGNGACTFLAGGHFPKRHPSSRPRQHCPHLGKYRATGQRRMHSAPADAAKGKSTVFVHGGGIQRVHVPRVHQDRTLGGEDRLFRVYKKRHRPLPNVRYILYQQSWRTKHAKAD